MNTQARPKARLPPSSRLDGRPTLVTGSALMVDGGWTAASTPAPPSVPLATSFKPAAERPDAVLVASDHMAFGVMDRLRFELGLRIPADVSVVRPAPPAAADGRGPDGGAARLIAQAWAGP